MEPLISSELLDEFKELYHNEFGEELSDEEALAAAVHLLGLFRAIYRPIPRDKSTLYKNLQRW